MIALFITILNMSITASIVALAVMLVRIPFRKVPKIFSYILWGAVLFRLVFPFSIESAFSLMPVFTNTISQEMIFSQFHAIQPSDIFIKNTLPMIENGINSASTILQVASLTWFCGFVVLLLYGIVGYISLKRRVYFATLLYKNVFQTDKIKAPFVLGLIRPNIYFPISIDSSQHDYILKHEQTHIKRRDYLIKPFAYMILAMHWFNPLIWLSYFLMSKDMEMSCDEVVLRKTNKDIRKDYSMSLLNLSIKNNNLLSPIVFAFGESNVKERVKNVLNFKKKIKNGYVLFPV